MTQPNTEAGDEESDSTQNEWLPLPVLTKREYFAGLAMQAIMANPLFNGYSAEATATTAFSRADAMLAESRKGAR